MFKIYGGATKFKQWTQDNKLIMDELPIGADVMFYNDPNEDDPLITEVYEIRDEEDNVFRVCDVPNILLTETEKIKVRIPKVAKGLYGNLYKVAGRNEMIFEVEPAEKPSDYVYEKTATNTIDPKRLPEGYPYKSPGETIAEWDGNTEGMVTADLGHNNFAYKVCELISFADLIGVEMKMFSHSPEGEESIDPVILEGGHFLRISDSVIQILYGAAWIFTDAAAASESMGANIPESGVYFAIMARGGGFSYPISLTTPETIHPMSADFLPTAASVSYLHSTPTAADYNALLASLCAANYISAIFPPWTQSNITSGSFYTVAYANSLWVAGSGGDGLYYSTDGQTWTQSNITSGSFFAVAYANGLWAAGSYNNGLYYSTDGQTWTQSNITSGSFFAVAYANGLWVAGSNVKGLYYSTDGQTWTQSNITSDNFFAVAYANGLWVAGSNVKGLYYSTDGQTWTQSNITSDNFFAVAYANGLWVAGSNVKGLYYSTDGQTWTQSNITSGNFYTVAYANGLWVAGGGSEGLYYSTDGQTWTQSNITSGDLNTAYNANGLWVAGGGSEGLYYSTDGQTWTQSNITSGRFSAVAYANGLWVAGGDGLYYSK